VMSKSKGNVVSQEEIAKKFGIDTARFFLMFVASADKDMEWDDKGVEGSYRFLNKLYLMITEKPIVKEQFKNQESKMHKVIKEVTDGIESFHYNQSLISIMQLTNYLNAQEKISRDAAEKLVVLLAPFTPHICEELWERMGNKPFISLESWPRHDDSKIDERIEAQELLVEQTMKDIRSILALAKIEKPQGIRLFVSANWKYEFFRKLQKELEATHEIPTLLKKLADKDHGREISQLVPRIIKDMSKMPVVILDQRTELEVLKKASESISKEFGASVELIPAEKSGEAKASQALPGKLAIVVS